MPRAIGAVTFDLWDCLFADDTDEPKRTAAGRPPKPVERRSIMHKYLNQHEPVSRELVDLAYNVTDAAFRKVWHDEHVTWPVRERLGVLLAGLGRVLPEPELAEAVRLHEEMELEFRPNPAPGALEALKAIHGKYPLVIISDAIFSPGRCLRELLRGAGMLEYFDHFFFSDEVGCSKPAPKVFQAAAAAVGCPVTDLVHIGDRPHNDINGPHAVGARGILLTVVKDRGSANSDADAICTNYADLPAILDRLAGV